MKKPERTQVVIDETTIYEVDLDCMECSGEDHARLENTSRDNASFHKEDA